MRFKNPIKPGARLGMPLEAWPLHDQEAWNDAFAAGSLLDDHPSGDSLREPSKITLATCYARWLAWNRDSRPEALTLPVEIRATKEHVVAYLTSLSKKLALSTTHNYAARLKAALELMSPTAEWSWFVPLLGRLERSARADRASTPKPFVAPDQLFAFGMEIMRQADDASVNDAVT